jgi:dihydrofolate reductase
MRISLIVAASENGVIGRAGELPWKLPADLKHFRTLTWGKPVVMGRKTWDSIGRALPGRQNIVLTRDPAFAAPGAQIASSPEEALRLAGDAPEVMIIGGGELYRAFLPRAERIYLTRVKTVESGDTLFPELDPAQWRQVAREAHAPDARHVHPYCFEILERVGGDAGGP